MNSDKQVNSAKFLLFENNSSLNANEKKFIIRGVFATIGVKNGNGRIYPRDLWEQEVKKFQKEIEEGTINTLMEWDHPTNRVDVDPSKAIAKIRKLWIEDDKVMGEAVLFDVPGAQHLKEMIKNGVQISVSSRGTGNVDNMGNVTEFELKTFDFVADPSDNSATMYGIYEKKLKEQNSKKVRKVIKPRIDEKIQYYKECKRRIRRILESLDDNVFLKSYNLASKKKILEIENLCKSIYDHFDFYKNSKNEKHFKKFEELLEEFVNGNEEHLNELRKEADRLYNYVYYLHILSGDDIKVNLAKNNLEKVYNDYGIKVEKDLLGLMNLLSLHTRLKVSKVLNSNHRINQDYDYKKVLEFLDDILIAFENDNFLKFDELIKNTKFK